MTSSAGWLGRLSLELTCTEHGTQLSRSSHEGPLRIQRVLKPEGNDCPHIYLLHPPGGVVGGDRLETSVELGSNAQVLLTTPAAQKLYRSQGARAEISNLLRLGQGARLEWLPSETLAFSSAHAELSTNVQLGPEAAFIGWDIACYGMPARGESFDAGRVVSRFELFRGETPLAVESFDLEQGHDLLGGAFALRGQPVVANLYAVPASGVIEPALVERVREAIGEPARGLCSVSSLQELLVVRALGGNVEGVRASLIAAWRVLRPVIVGRAPVTPRIWAT
ncbi:MAG TPA: urease accessory protein UreD [Polyangiaceae bacterium]|nr:urease accessory protein UreD [Polyangiaceae bacterium]